MAAWATELFELADSQWARHDTAMSVVLSETKTGVCIITMNRPEARNALSSELIVALREAMVAAEQDPDVAVVVLSGSVPAFCAGLDLKDLGSGRRNLREGVGCAGEIHIVTAIEARNCCRVRVPKSSRSLPQ